MQSPFTAKPPVGVSKIISTEKEQATGSKKWEWKTESLSKRHMQVKKTKKTERKNGVSVN